MNVSTITSCYLGPHISPEQFIAENFFLYLLRGAIDGYDGHRHYTLHPGQSCLVRKNHLARYHKQKDEGSFGKVVIIFDETFLKTFHSKHPTTIVPYTSPNAFLPLQQSEHIDNYIASLEAHYMGEGKIDPRVADAKREELLLLLLHQHPEYAAILFDFGKPGKIDLKAFMNRNYKFNVSIDRLAYLTGRSRSAFKRDFTEIFQDTPAHWLVQRRLKEAYFLITQKGRKPGDIYLDLGFEDLSHFSFAFKKSFGLTPTAAAKNIL